MNKIIKIILTTLLSLVFLFIIVVLSINFFSRYFSTLPTSMVVEMNCIINSDSKFYNIYYDSNEKILSFKSNDYNFKPLDLEKYNDINDMIYQIKNYVDKSNGTCGN